MKKIILAAASAVVLCGMIACGNKNAANQGDQAFADSLSVSIGQVQGAQLLQAWNNLPDSIKEKFPKDAFLEGLKAILMQDTTKIAYVQGAGLGMQLWDQIYQYQSNGVNVDRGLIYNTFAQIFKGDSVAQDDLARYMTESQGLQLQMRQRMMEEQQRRQAAAEEATRNAPETQQAIKDGQAYIAKQKADGATVTSSGLAYKVMTPGAGEKPAATDRVKINYKGMHTDGTVFDQNEGAEFPVNGVIPGFAEGLQLMQKGGKYILYIPGELAYGVNGTPDGSIKPMETLVFEIELLDINPAK